MKHANVNGSAIHDFGVYRWYYSDVWCLPTESADTTAAVLSTKILIGRGEWSSWTTLSPAISLDRKRLMQQRSMLQSNDIRSTWHQRPNVRSSTIKTYHTDCGSNCTFGPSLFQLLAEKLLEREEAVAQFFCPYRGFTHYLNVHVMTSSGHPTIPQNRGL